MSSQEISVTQSGRKIKVSSNNNIQRKLISEIFLNETLVLLGRKKRFHLLEEILILSGQLPTWKSTDN